MSLFDQQWVEGRIPFQFIMPQTSGSGGSGELPGTGDLIPDTDTRVIGNTAHRWKELVVEDIQASDTITTNSIQTATATVGGVMSAGQTSVSELTILQSNDDGSLLTGAGTGTFRIRRGASELDTTAISLTDHSIELIRVNGDAGLSLNTLNGTTTASSAFQANHISSATDINALGGTVTGQVLQGNANMATPLIYVTSIQPINSEAATIGTSSNRWKTLWGRVVNTTSLVTGTIEAASQTISGALNVSGTATAHELISSTGVTANSVQANSVFSSPLSYMNQILPISYDSSTLGNISNYWKEIWATTINAASVYVNTVLRTASLIVTGVSTLNSALVQTNLVVVGSTTSASVAASGALTAASVTASGALTAASSTVTNAVVTGNLVGSVSNDYTVYTASVVPKDTDYWSLGSESKFWKYIHAGSLYARSLTNIAAPLWNGMEWENNYGLWVNSSTGTATPYLKVNYTDLYGTTTIRNPDNTSGIEVGNGDNGLIRLSSAGGVQINGGGIQFDGNGLRVKHLVGQTTNASNLDTLCTILRPGIIIGSWYVYYKIWDSGLPTSYNLLDCRVVCQREPGQLPGMYSNATNLQPWIPPFYAGGLGFDGFNAPRIDAVSELYYEAWPQEGALGTWEVGLAIFENSGSAFNNLSRSVIGRPVTIDITYI